MGKVSLNLAEPGRFGALIPVSNIVNQYFFPFVHSPASDTDNVFRGKEIPGPLLQLQQRLRGSAHVLRPLQLHQGGERRVGDLRETQLQGLPVHSQPGRVRGQSAVDGVQ